MKQFRDILLVPNFDNVKITEEIRKKYDELYNNFFPKHLSDRVYVPHITIGQTFNIS